MIGKQVNWVEVAPHNLLIQKRYSSPPKLETIFEEDNIEFLHVIKRNFYFLPLLLFMGSFLVFCKNLKAF